jgi:hypothetical protein
MTETQIKIDLDIPTELLVGNAEDINYDLLRGKTIIGLCGYAKSGKDSIAKQLISKLGFKRLSFGDAMKDDLNEYMKEFVYRDILERGLEISYEEMDFKTHDEKLKDLLRPYMIWFGQEMRRRNGMHFWTNRALETITNTDTKIVISDIRRISDFEMFKFNREFIKKKLFNRSSIGVPHGPTDDARYDCEFESLLMYVNKFGHTDSDSITVNAVSHAHEQWLFDHTIQLDSRLPSEFYEKHIKEHLKKLVNLFPDYFV